MKKRPALKIVGEYMMIDGVKTKIDPTKTDLPDRCLQALAYMVTGRYYELVEAKGDS